MELIRVPPFELSHFKEYHCLFYFQIGARLTEMGVPPDFLIELVTFFIEAAMGVVVYVKSLEWDIRP